jgi:hypothetical protein
MALFQCARLRIALSIRAHSQRQEIILRIDDVLILRCAVSVRERPPHSFLCAGEEKKTCGVQLDLAEDGGRLDAQPAAAVAVVTSTDFGLWAKQVVAGMAR